MSDAAGIVQLVGRIMFGLYFVFTGAGFHIPKSRMAEEYAASVRFPVPGSRGGRPASEWRPGACRSRSASGRIWAR
jgi:hypothetical protein